MGKHCLPHIYNINLCLQMKHLSILFFSLLGISPLLKAQGIDDSQRIRVENLMTTFHLNEATEACASLPSPYKEFYLINISMYRFAATQDNTYMDEFINQFHSTIAAIENLPESDSRKGVLLAEISGKRAIIEFIKKDYVSAAWHVKNTFSYIQANQKKFPNEASNKKMAGAFNIILSNVPSDYQWFMNMLGFKGYFNTGYEQLKKAAQEDIILRAEANFVLFFTERNLLGKPKEGLQCILNEQKKTGKSIVTDLFLASSYFALNDNEKALQVLSKRNLYANNEAIFYVPFWDYLLGKSYFFKEDYTNAAESFELFLAKMKGNVFLTDARFRTGVAYLLNGSYTAAKPFFQRVSERPKTGLDEDNYAITSAKRFLQKEPSSYTKQLYRARNLYDGGYFTESINMLEGIKKNIASLSQENRVELYYRFGRVYHTADFPNAAKAAYAACISEAYTSQNVYMQAYSNYYLGELHRKEGNKEEARKYYKKALTYDEYSYQNGLETKCKTALGRL